LGRGGWKKSHDPGKGKSRLSETILNNNEEELIMSLKRIICVAICIMMILVLPVGSLGEDKEPIKIGLLTPLTGYTAANGIDIKSAVELWLSQHDSKVGGFPVEIIIEDDEANASSALTKAQKLVEMDGCKILVGPSITAALYSVKSYCEEAGVMLLTSTAAGDDATMLQASDYLVRSSTASSQMLHPLGDFCAKELGLKKVALLGYDFLYGYETTGGFQRVFEENGGKVAWKQLIPNNLTDYSSIIASMPLDDVDGLVFIISGANAIQFEKQLIEYGVTDKKNLTIVAGVGGAEETFFSEMSPKCAGFYTVQNFYAEKDGKNPRKEQLMKDFEAKTGKIVSTNTAQFWSAMEILDKALAKLDKLGDAVEISKTIRSDSYDTVIGPIRFDDHGQSIPNVYIRQLQYVDGQLSNKLIKTYEGVSQFWTYDPQEFMNGQRYSETWPTVTP
jgi:branched-chain amino acid transport system substrate-binding protein